MTHYSPLQLDENGLQKYVRLFNASFPGVTKFSVPYLQWLYVDNPAGGALGFDYVLENGEIGAHFATIPATINRHNCPLRALLNLNSATHPSCQRQGLYTQLANLTYDAARQQGYDCVFGVSNAQATPGLIQKLDFQLVRQLEAKIHFSPYSSSGVPNSGELSFERTWDAPQLEWRLRDPNSKWQAYHTEASCHLFGPGPSKFVPSYEEVPRVYEEGSVGNIKKLPKPRLFLGLRPNWEPQAKFAFNIPKKLWPSPLNFIYRNMQDKSHKLNPENVSFKVIDFDAY